MDQAIINTYSQSGSALPYFVGKQQGRGGWLRAIARFAFPIVKNLVRSAGRVAAGTAEDVIEGKPLGESVRSQAFQEVGRVLNNRASSINRPAAKRKATSTKGTIYDRKRARRK